MFELYDRVLHLPSGKQCFVIDVDEGIDEKTGVPGVIYAVESEDQSEPNWFYWADEEELRKIPEHK